MKKELELIQEANELIRSFNCIIDRKGKNTDWDTIGLKAAQILNKQIVFLTKDESECEHKWVYSRSISYWQHCGRNSREYYHADYYFCEKCLEEKVIEKRHSCYDSEVWKLPDWAKVINNKVKGYE